MLSLSTSFPRTWLFSFKKEKRKRNRALTTVLIQLLHHFTFFILQKCITNTNTYKHNKSLLCPIFLISQWPTVSPWRLLKPEGQSADCSGSNACLPACYAQAESPLPSLWSNKGTHRAELLKWHSPCPACTWV